MDFSDWRPLSVAGQRPQFGVLDAFPASMATEISLLLTKVDIPKFSVSGTLFLTKYTHFLFVSGQGCYKITILKLKESPSRRSMGSLCAKTNTKDDKQV